MSELSTFVVFDPLEAKMWTYRDKALAMARVTAYMVGDRAVDVAILRPHSDVVRYDIVYPYAEHPPIAGDGYAPTCGCVDCRRRRNAVVDVRRSQDRKLGDEIAKALTAKLESVRP